MLSQIDSVVYGRVASPMAPVLILTLYNLHWCMVFFYVQLAKLLALTQCKLMVFVCHLIADFVLAQVVVLL